MKPVIPREQANRDINNAIAFYLGEGGYPAALSCIDDLEQAYGHIGDMPALDHHGISTSLTYLRA
jgi:hypothetical protein